MTRITARSRLFFSFPPLLTSGNPGSARSFLRFLRPPALGFKNARRAGERGERQEEAVLQLPSVLSPPRSQGGAAGTAAGEGAATGRTHRAAERVVLYRSARVQGL